MTGLLAIAALVLNPCSLDPSILTVYETATPSLEAAAATRRAVADFMACDPATLDEPSRRVFFAVVEREFSTDPAPQLEAFQKQYPGSEALWEGINMQQHELREYLDRLFDPVRDREFKDVVLRFGKGHTIALLGPEAKKDVKRILAEPNRFYGISRTYNSWFEAAEAQTILAAKP